MEGFLGRYSTYIYAIFRIVIGFLIVVHGTQKWLDFPPAKEGSSHPPLIMAAGVIELVCGLLIMVGFFSSFAAFLASGMFAVAYFMVHQPGGALPIMNGGELAVAYCFACLYISSRGSGLWSVDSIFRGTVSTS